MRIIEDGITKLGLLAKAYNKILIVNRTIADLCNGEIFLVPISAIG